jgi:hypothetical protein
MDRHTSIRILAAAGATGPVFHRAASAQPSQKAFRLAREESKPKLPKFKTMAASRWIAKSFPTSLIYIALGGSAFAQNGCLNSVSELIEKHIQTRWKETTASDNLPLIISINNGKNGLTYTAIKNGQLWLYGGVSVCLKGVGQCLH